MKNTIFTRFKENKKWSDYINWRSFECRFAFVFGIISIYMAIQFNIYSKLNIFLEPLKTITVYVATALLGMLGTILAGLAIIIWILQMKVVKTIEKVNGPKSIHNVLVSFEFLAFNIGIGIVTFYLIYLALYNVDVIVPRPIFYTLTFILVYYCAFIIFYTIGLISNCIRVFNIANLYSEIDENQKQVIDIANELRIDFLLNKVLNDNEKERFIRELLQYVEDSNVPDKDAIKDYFKQYYQI